jgi:ketosteroid isomerase-like protein
MLRPYCLLVAVAVLTACTTRTIRPREVTAVGGSGSGSAEVQAVVQLALTLDAAGDSHADTLYTADALVVGNARIRQAAPRFAGITIGAGRVTVSAANATIEGRVAWVLVDYRWVNPTERRAEVGRATVICERRGESWKIVHAHSSQPLPWEP